MKRQFLTINSRQTKEVAKFLITTILKRKNKKAVVLGLVGDLGSGKTTFTQGIARALGIKEKILSPTFTILKRYKNFYHLDCYRLESQKELLTLGFNEIISNSQNIVIIEWADRIKKIMPKDTIWINIKFIDKKTRNIIWKIKNA